MNKSVSIAVVILLLLLGGWYWSSMNATVPPPDSTTADQTVVEPVPVTDKILPPTPAPKTTTTAPTVPAKPTTANKDIFLVTYTDKGFSPFTAEISAGQAIKFVNQSSKPMWITSFDHNTGSNQQIYPEFDEGKSVPKGQSFTFNFIKTGTWGYKNLNYPQHIGAVAVRP